MLQTDNVNSGDGSWGHLEKTERFGRISSVSDFTIVAKNEYLLSKYVNPTQAAHCMIFAKCNEKVFGLYDPRAAILMQMRFDGNLGFPGGLVDDGEDATTAINRELVEEMNLDIIRHPIKEHHHVVTHYSQSKNLFLNFYALQVTLRDLKEIERKVLDAEDYGTEVLGCIRVPLYTMGDNFRGFPSFLKNSFIGNSRQQLLFCLKHFTLMTDEEIYKAEKAVPTNGEGGTAVKIVT